MVRYALIHPALMALAILAMPATVDAAPPKARPKAAAKTVAKPAPQPADAQSIEAATHDAYLAAINSNDIAAFSDAVTDDAVFQYPGAPQMVGKKAIVAWATTYFQLYTTRWEKVATGFTVAGDWAFEHYTYKSLDTDKSTGTASYDAGKGVAVFHHDKDGKWRVAIDGWSSDSGGK
ncbi:YybH family protein [Sphingomonas immobilis]|uniref:Nuclear transport factor 2 family protein n=1 Tax=Sphingomonas immobilis TaxID=3063997 RepID=A0ABT8ZWM8_9SPHN|nr:nuclear transport factor 2 family protein [Sphingomonas sp. CA1-15]MDO7841622.1 nuclear transport factor 2 family protein [Sphingomonas sp. CA1-15]